MVLVALALDGRYLRLPGHDRRVRADGTRVDGSSVFERVELGHDRVALRTLDGDYLTMLPDPGQNFGLYAREELTPAAAFEEVLWPSGQVSLRSAELTYVAVDRDAVTVNRTDAPAGARLTYVRPPGVVPRQRSAYSPAGETVPAAGHAGGRPRR